MVIMVTKRPALIVFLILDFFVNLLDFFFKFILLRFQLLYYLYYVLVL